METVMDDLDVRLRRVSRTKRKKKKAVIGIAPRFLLIVAIALLMAYVCYASAVKIMQPYKMQRQQAAQIRALRSQIAINDSSNSDLQAQIAYLKRPDGIQTAARAQGYLKPGEVSLQVKANPSVAKPATTSSGFTGMIHRAWAHFMHR